MLMGGAISAKVYRHDPGTGEPPRFDTFKVPASEPLTVLSILDYIYEHLDHTLAYRDYRCFLAVCTSCVLLVDGKPVRSCIELVNPGEEVFIEPRRRDMVIRDLVISEEKSR